MKKGESSFLSILDDILMVVLALVSAAILLVEYSTPLSPHQLVVLDTIDISIALVFLAEFCINFIRAKDKKLYWKKEWWALLASIPITTPATQGLRLLRLFRLLRLLRLIPGLRNILDYLERFIEDTHAIAVLVVWFLVMLLGAGSFFGLEHLAHTPHLSFFDSFWWSVSTATTVGYGDIYPLTSGGRIVAMVLMIVGIGTTGVFTALVASFFLKEK